MKTKTRTDNEPKKEASGPPPIAENPSAPAPVVEEKINRISIALNKDGAIDWDSMRPKTQEKVKQLMGIGEGKGPQAAAVEVFDASWTGPLYDTLGKIESFAAMKMYGFSPEVADKAFTYSEAEKAKLGPPTAKVINKYAPVWMEQFKDEIALAMLFVTITAMKFQMASFLMAQQKAQAPKPPERKPDSGLPSGIDLDIVTAEREMAKN
jgi:hypothetical protein